MAYRYESSHFEAENEAFSYNSMGHMGHNGHNSHLGFGNGMGHHQIGGCSNYGQANSGYGMGLQHGMGHQLGLGHNHGMGMGHNHGNGFHHGGGQMASGYAMSQENNYYSSHNSYNPCKKVIFHIESFFQLLFSVLS